MNRLKRRNDGKRINDNNAFAVNTLSTVISFCNLFVKRRATLQNLLSNYKKISLNLQPANHKNRSFSACGHCALCDNYGTHKTWSQTLILSKLKTIKLFNLTKISTLLISVFMPLVQEFILVKLKTIFSYFGIHTAIWNNNTWDLKRQHYLYITIRTTLNFHLTINLFPTAVQLLSFSSLQTPI